MGGMFSYEQGTPVIYLPSRMALASAAARAFFSVEFSPPGSVSSSYFDGESLQGVWRDKLGGLRGRGLRGNGSEFQVEEACGFGVK